MRRHHLADRRESDPTAICTDVCGVQAQVMSAAHLALWTRARSMRRENIDAALFDKRSIVKTKSLRMTLHLIPAAEFPSYVMAVRSCILNIFLNVAKRCGVQRREIDTMNEMFLEALRDGPLTQRELRERVRPQVSARLRKWMDLIWSPLNVAHAEGLIVYGPARGQEITLVRTDRWLGRQRTISEDAARLNLLRWYLRVYAPATPRDFAKWSGASAKDASAAWHALKDELVDVAGERPHLAILRKDRQEFEKAARDSVVRLLPNFDSYLLGHSEKDHVVAKSHYKKIYRAAGWISPVVLVDGRAVATWAAAKKGEGVAINVEPFEKLTASVREMVAAESASMAEFLGAPVMVRFGKK